MKNTSLEFSYTIIKKTSDLGVVHNCQHLPISTESTNLGGGRGAEASYRTIL